MFDQLSGHCSPTKLAYSINHHKSTNCQLGTCVHRFSPHLISKLGQQDHSSTQHNTTILHTVENVRNTQVFLFGVNVLLVYPVTVSWIYTGSLALLAVCLGPKNCVFSPSPCGSLNSCSQAPSRSSSLRVSSFANIFFLFFLILVVSLYFTNASVIL